MTGQKGIRDAWDVRAIGFFTEFLPSHCPKLSATESLNAILLETHSSFINQFHNPNTYQPGGTAMAVRYPLSQHISNQIQDPMGRWAGITLKVKGNPSLTILSMYLPVKYLLIIDTINETRQQTRWLEDRNIIISSKVQYHRDCTNYGMYSSLMGISMNIKVMFAPHACC
jgi:hypothetical protein